jgi:hypothetical protein
MVAAKSRMLEAEADVVAAASAPIDVEIRSAISEFRP